MKKIKIPKRNQPQSRRYISDKLKKVRKSPNNQITNQQFKCEVCSNPARIISKTKPLCLLHFNQLNNSPISNFNSYKGGRK